MYGSEVTVNADFWQIDNCYLVFSNFDPENEVVLSSVFKEWVSCIEITEKEPT